MRINTRAPPGPKRGLLQRTGRQVGVLPTRDKITIPRRPPLHPSILNKSNYGPWRLAKASPPNGNPPCGPRAFRLAMLLGSGWYLPCYLGHAALEVRQGCGQLCTSTFRDFWTAQGATFWRNTYGFRDFNVDTCVSQARRWS